MRIDAKETAAGVPMLKVRALFRMVQGGDNSVVERILGVDPERAELMLSELEAKGYIVRDSWRWTATDTGDRLRLATAASPILRKTADRLLDGFMSRVRQVRDDPNLLYKATKVIIFGSYLTDVERLGDIDLAVELKPKIADRCEFRRLREAKICEAKNNGRYFSYYGEELSWPEREVKMFLKNRSGYLRLHSPEDQVLKIAAQKVIYSDDA